MQFSRLSFIFLSLFSIGLADPCLSDNDCTYDMRCDKQLDNTEAYCVYRNLYQSCGGNTPIPTTCDDDKNGRSTTCLDDPRKEGCGMACDAPGICLPKDVPWCGGFIGKACPEGLFCYYPRATPEQAQCADCTGQCL